jgi:hypothetical protein
VLAIPAAHAQLLPTNGSVASRLGSLELQTGYPTDATVAKVFDDINFQRGCQAYLWALPIMAMQQWQNEHLTRFGAGKLDYVDYLTFQDKLGLLTAKRHDAIHHGVSKPARDRPARVRGSRRPHRRRLHRFLATSHHRLGQTGPDKGAGGRYLILGPDPSHLAGGSPMERRTTARPRLLGRPLEDHPGGTVHERDRIMMGILQPLGIEKGKPFTPTERQRQILIDAAQTGEVMARAIAYRKRFEGAKVWPGRNWEISLLLEETNQEAPHHTQLDERSSWFYEAVGVSVAQFWSVNAYDNETRCFVNTGVPPARSSRDAIVTNADGSVDLTFGPVASAGVPESNWIKTLPSKGWFSSFRLHGPTLGYFDRSWELADFEMIQ